MILDINKQISEACNQIAEGINGKIKKAFERAVIRNLRIIEYGDDWDIDWIQVWKEVEYDLKEDVNCTKDDGGKK